MSEHREVLARDGSKHRMLPESGRGDSEQQWISVSDLMAGLLVVFLLLAAVANWQAEAQFDADGNVIGSGLYAAMQADLHRTLAAEFKDDLPRWSAELLPDLTIRFLEPDILFEAGSSAIQPVFRGILQEFFPRYIAIVGSDSYRAFVEELRIEGHTSSEWITAQSDLEAFLLNMRLSQARSQAVLEYVLLMPEVEVELPWLRGHIAANGFSSGRPVMDDASREIHAKSRRVEFRIRISGTPANSERKLQVRE